MDRVVKFSTVMVVGLILVTGCSAEAEYQIVSKPLGSQGEAPDTSQQSPEETLVVELGSRDNPLQIGSTALLDDGDSAAWEITLGPAQLDATEFVLADDEGNEAPPDGLQWAILSVSAKYTGSRTGDASSDLQFAFIADDGTAYSRFSTPGAGIWNSLGDSPELYAGETAKGGVLVAIPSEKPENGTWRIGLRWGEEVVYFAAE